ncbi:MAG: DUF1634 domain-containing protein [Thermoplasmatota archaeon]
MIAAPPAVPAVAPTNPPPTVDFNRVIGLLLRTGVTISVATVALGSLLLFAENNTGYYPLTSAQNLVERHNAFLLGPIAVFQGLLSIKPYAIIDLGILILLATPLARVVVSLFLFYAERRYVFVAITGAVLVILLFSMFVIAPFISAALAQP